jgi:aminoglycoside phosphotransferase (APT) family kinase protein
MTTPPTDPPGTAGADTAEISQRLQQFLAAQPDARDHRITHLSRAGSGRSRDNWLFELTTPAGEEPLILRADPAGGLIDTDRSVEFAVLQGLEKSDLPTPVPRWLDADGDALGRPSLIMRRLPGVCDYRVLRDTRRPMQERIGLARAFCELLAAVHAVDWRALGLGETLPDPGPQAARAWLDTWAQVLRKDQLEPWPEIEYAIALLAERAPTSSGTVLVHADFKPGNILLDGARITALLDWELAHLGDPLEDLGWVTQPLRAAEHTIEGAWESAALLSHYERSSGRSIDRAALAWWVAFSSFKTAVMQVSGLRAFVDGRAEEPYRPTRRVLATMLDAVQKVAR